MMLSSTLFSRLKSRLCLFTLVLLLSSCAAPPPKVPVPGPPIKEPVEEVPPSEVSVPALQPVSWDEVTGWSEDDQALVMGAFLKSCRTLRFRPQWRDACAESAELDRASSSTVRAYFEQNFVPYMVRKEDGDVNGLLTGYYVPDLRGSRSSSPEYAYPLYGRPDDLLVIDLDELYPSLANLRLRGRVDGHRVIPYWDRAEIDGSAQPLSGAELFWINDPVELFFLHIQGSGRILLDDGSSALVNYADQNGYPYKSIGKYLIERGAMTRDQMSMQNIRRWAEEHPDEVADLLNENPSYVFFRELPADVMSPPGALGVPLTPGRSLAVDPRHIPLGAPVFVDTTMPNSSSPLRRLMVAQDTGGAIKGRVRGDFFWGMGARAGQKAGRMKQPARFWVLLPKSGEEEGI